MRVVGYVRVSTEEQATGGHSLEAQAAKLRLYAELHELELVDVVPDPGVSGKSLRRPGLERALDMLRTGLVEGLLVAKLDRLTRNVADMGALIAELFSERAGKTLLSCADHIDTRTAAGRLVLNVLVSCAQWEREATVERVREVVGHLRRTGRVYGTTPLGFVETTDGRLEPDEGEQATCRRILELAAEGRSLRAIAQALTEEGRQTKQGGRWQPFTVSRVLGRLRAPA